MDKPVVVVISVHLGSGKLGELRRQALLAQAALAGHTYNGNASIGRWLVAQADEWLAQIERAIQETKGNEP